MATNTTNLGLKKPAGTDYVLVSDFNTNSDTIDAATGKLSTLETVEKTNLVGAINEARLTGAGVTIKGLYATEAALRAAHATGVLGDAYAVGTAEANTIFIWDTVTSDWLDVGTLKGAPGDLSNLATTAVTFTEAATLATIASGDTIAVLFGKLKKWYTDFADRVKAVLFGGTVTTTIADTEYIPVSVSGTSLKKITWANVKTILGNLYAALSHAHGNISNDGKIGSTANLPVFTGAEGAIGTKTAADARTALGVDAASTSASLTPLNGWSVLGSYALTVTKSGKVGNIVGTISGGTTADATSLLVLPAGYLPAILVWATCTAPSAGIFESIVLNTNGSVTIAGTWSAGNHQFNISYPIA